MLKFSRNYTVGISSCDFYTLENFIFEIEHTCYIDQNTQMKHATNGSVDTHNRIVHCGTNIFIVGCKVCQTSWVITIWGPIQLQVGLYIFAVKRKRNLMDCLVCCAPPKLGYFMEKRILRKLVDGQVFWMYIYIYI